MTWARVWGRVKILVKTWLTRGESLISLSMGRMARDREEFRRHARAHPGHLAKVLTILDIIVTIVFIIVSIVMLVLSTNENPTMPLRMWIIGYAIYCALHVTFSIGEYRGGRRWQRLSTMVNARMVENGNDGFYLVWWALGIFFIMKGNNDLFKSAPKLTGTIMLFSTFDIMLFMGVLYLVMVFALLLLCCVPFLCATFYCIGDPQELPPCPWC